MLTVLVALLITGADAQPPSVNAVLGDSSFVAAYGRAPRDADDEDLRIRVHLEHVLRLLRARGPASAARAHSLDLLAAYVARGEFPRNDGHPDARRPTFIDERGRICAVGYLIEQTLGRGVAEAIARRAKYAYIAELAPALDAWARAAGLTVEELAMIQPSYRCMHPAGPTRIDPPPAAFLGDPAPTRSGMSLGAALPFDGDGALTARAAVVGGFARRYVAGAHAGVGRHAAEAGAVAGWVERKGSIVAHVDAVLPAWSTPTSTAAPLLRPRDAALLGAGDEVGATVGVAGSLASDEHTCGGARCLIRVDAGVTRASGDTLRRVGVRAAYQLPMVTLGVELAAVNAPGLTGVAAAGATLERRRTTVAAATVHYTARRGWGGSPRILQWIRPGLAAVASFGDERAYGVLLDFDIPFGGNPVPYFNGRRDSCDE